jgi:hypothetical protein
MSTGELPAGGRDGPVTELGTGVPTGKTGSVQLLVVVLVDAAPTGAGVSNTITEAHAKRSDPITHPVRKLLCIGFPRRRR